jgi:hypothetical protein
VPLYSFTQALHLHQSFLYSKMATEVILPTANVLLPNKDESLHRHSEDGPIPQSVAVQTTESSDLAVRIKRSFSDTDMADDNAAAMGPPAKVAKQKDNNGIADEGVPSSSVPGDNDDVREPILSPPVYDSQVPEAVMTAPDLDLNLDESEWREQNPGLAKLSTNPLHQYFCLIFERQALRPDAAETQCFLIRDKGVNRAAYLQWALLSKYFCKELSCSYNMAAVPSEDQLVKLFRKHLVDANHPAQSLSEFFPDRLDAVEAFRANLLSFLQEEGLVVDDDHGDLETEGTRFLRIAGDVDLSKTIVELHNEDYSTLLQLHECGSSRIIGLPITIVFPMLL